MEEFLRYPELAATAGHLAVVQRKLDLLNRAKQDAWAQVLTATARLYAAGDLRADDLVRLLDEMRTWYGPGFSKTWDRVFTGPVAAKSVRHLAGRERRLRRDEAIRTWEGTFPLDGQLVPGAGVPVVYVLFDELNEPVYVGSTECFWTRMSGHHIRREHRIDFWVAYRCNDREHAYEVEERLLAEHKPRLNKRTTR